MEQPNLPIIEYSEYGRTIKATASGGERLDVFLASSCGETRSYVRRLIVEGEASINGKEETKAGAKLKAGDAVELFIALPASTELAANLFRATQTEEKLRRENIQGKQAANNTHYEVGKKVRQTIAELGGTMPEDLPTPEKSIQQLEREQKKKLK